LEDGIHGNEDGAVDVIAAGKVGPDEYLLIISLTTRLFVIKDFLPLQCSEPGRPLLDPPEVLAYLVEMPMPRPADANLVRALK
jgi:hypothetical protein